jgi:hypothetical protein
MLNDKSCRVAIISAQKLARCSIPWGPSDALVKRCGGSIRRMNNLEGVRFAWPRHVLAYGWVPAQCILDIFTGEEFIGLCKEHNINERKHVWSSPQVTLLTGEQMSRQS